MSPKVVAIGKAQPVQAVIECAEMLLRRAISGEIREMMAFGVMLDGSIFTHQTQSQNGVAMLAAVTVAQHTFASAMVNNGQALPAPDDEQ